MEFLGPNLQQLFQYCGKQRFTLGTVCLLAMQIINRIEIVHKKHYLHRNINPDNICIGNDDKTNIIILKNYGQSKRFKNDKTNQQIPYRESKPFIGNSLYASVNAHLGVELSRRDDLISIGYILIYFLKGFLPWNDTKIKGDDRLAKIMEKKINISNEL